MMTEHEISFSQLRCFIAVVDAGSLAKAGRQINADQMPDASLFVRRRMGSPEDIARLAHPADHFHSS